MEGKRNRKNVLIPSAMMAVVGLLVGTAVGPAPLTGSIAALEAGQGTAASTVDARQAMLQLLDADLTRLSLAANGCPNDFEPEHPWSDQNVGCTFVCPPPAGTVTVHVDADDPDAWVSGTGSCGVHDAHCSDRDYCTDTVGYTAEAQGSCAGEADEAWASGVYVNCYANAEDGPPKDPGGPDRCVVEKPLKVCFDPSVRSSGLATLSAFGILCQDLYCEYDIGDGTLVIRNDHGQPSITIGGFAGKALAAICDETGACRLVVPTLVQDEGTTRFIV